MSKEAFVTLATNDTYGLGALVLGRSLRRVATSKQTVVLITPDVSQKMKEELGQVFNFVVTVDTLDSGDAAHLALMARPELGVTFTKLHAWRLVQFTKCVFLDADTLVVQNCDELFEREELSAAPDPGWPDCFNTGVFVFVPSEATFKALLDFAVVHGSFDGGDQGLLNMFFKDWATADIRKHLPFVYNVVSSATYTYLPALKFFGKEVKIVHFLGSNKPWLRQGEVSSSTPYQRAWWSIFREDVAGRLSPDMIATSSLTGSGPPSISLPTYRFKDPWEAVRTGSHGWDQQHRIVGGGSNLNISRTSSVRKSSSSDEIVGDPRLNHSSEFNAKIPSSVVFPSKFSASDSSSHQYHSHEAVKSSFTNINARKPMPAGHIKHFQTQNNQNFFNDGCKNVNSHLATQNKRTINFYEKQKNELKSNNGTEMCPATSSETTRDHHHPALYLRINTNDNKRPTKKELSRKSNSAKGHYLATASSSKISNGTQFGTTGTSTETNQPRLHTKGNGHEATQGNDERSNDQTNFITEPNKSSETGTIDHFVIYQTDKNNSETPYVETASIDYSVQSYRFVLNLSTETDISETSHEHESVYERDPACHENNDAGVAGSLARGEPEDWRREAWEAGDVDYLGRDSFDNIWKRICECVGITAQSPSTPSEPTKESAAKPVPEKPAETAVAAEKAIEVAPVTEEPVKPASETPAGSTPAEKLTESPVAEEKPVEPVPAVEKPAEPLPVELKTEKPAEVAAEKPAEAAAEKPAEAAQEKPAEAAAEKPAEGISALEKLATPTEKLEPAPVPEKPVEATPEKPAEVALAIEGPTPPSKPSEPAPETEKPAESVAAPEKTLEPKSPAEKPAEVIPSPVEQKPVESAPAAGKVVEPIPEIPADKPSEPATAAQKPIDLSSQEPVQGDAKKTVEAKPAIEIPSEMPVAEKTAAPPTVTEKPKEPTAEKPVAITSEPEKPATASVVEKPVETVPGVEKLVEQIPAEQPVVPSPPAGIQAPAAEVCPLKSAPPAKEKPASPAPAPPQSAPSDPLLESGEARVQLPLEGAEAPVCAKPGTPTVTPPSGPGSPQPADVAPEVCKLQATPSQPATPPASSHQTGDAPVPPKRKQGKNGKSGKGKK